MAEDPESSLQLPPSTAAEGEGPTEGSPETVTPEPPSSAAVSPGTEEPVGDTKKKNAFNPWFIYVNQSFAPSPDQEVGTLYECFGSDGKLVLHYCKSQAWG
ncbi:Ubiquitin-like protein ATG12 [Camelus dromedarius]|uniref:Ubiquitin-like protein ATG12 n=1 Tax=Camelus dromedarius TaxID=9838 RepID=A0A5N4EE62_CAMDR|nr:Ubiquitin-like protein ATG12 [Camelus dromedarius]